MQKVKLSSLKDGVKFFISQRSRIAYQITQKVKGGIVITAIVSQKTYIKKKNQLVVQLP